jgi:hypothetical protein
MNKPTPIAPNTLINRQTLNRMIGSGGGDNPLRFKGKNTEAAEKVYAVVMSAIQCPDDPTASPDASEEAGEADSGFYGKMGEIKIEGKTYEKDEDGNYIRLDKCACRELAGKNDEHPEQLVKCGQIEVIKAGQYDILKTLEIYYRNKQFCFAPRRRGAKKTNLCGFAPLRATIHFCRILMYLWSNPAYDPDGESENAEPKKLDWYLAVNRMDTIYTGTLDADVVGVNGTANITVTDSDGEEFLFTVHPGQLGSTQKIPSGSNVVVGKTESPIKLTIIQSPCTAAAS